MPLLDPSTIPDDELRPWIVDHDYEHKVLEAMSKFDEAMSETSHNRNWGSHTDSDLDKFRHEDVMQFADSQNIANDSYEMEEKEDNIDHMVIHDDDSVGSCGDVPQMLQTGESDDDDNNDEERRDEYVPLDEDEEVLKLTSSLNNIDAERFKKTRMLRLLMEKEKKRRESEFRHGKTEYCQTSNMRRIPSAKWMPVHKTRVYQEWVNAQNTLRMENMKAKAYLLDRPTTAFIESLIDKEREILSDSFKNEDEKRAKTAEEAVKNSQQFAEEEQRKLKLKDIHNQQKCYDRFNKLYPSMKIDVPSSPISSECSSNSRPATSAGQSDIASIRDPARSPLRPLTAEEKSHLSFKRTKPTFQDKRCDMTLVLGLKDINQSNFPSASKNTIPSLNSPIVKYRTPREQMLDSISITTKAEEDEAKRKAANRFKEASKALQDIRSSKPDSGRFNIPRPCTPLDKIGINTLTGTLKNDGIQRPVFMKPSKQKVKELRDLMKTTSGVNSRLFNKGFQSKIPYNAQAERQKTLIAAASTKTIDNTDSTTETLITPGFFQALGPEKIFLSQSGLDHSFNEKYKKQLANRERSHITEADDLKKWAKNSIIGGRKLFNSGGGGFHFS